jgi:hypothetical protein
VPELEVQERPPSTLRNVDGGPPGGAKAGDSEVGDVDGGPPWGVLAASPAAATIEIEDVDGGPLCGAGDRSSSGHIQS